MVRQRLIRDDAQLPDNAILVRLLFEGLRTAQRSTGRS